MAAGVRRIEAITGDGALADYQRAGKLLARGRRAAARRRRRIERSARAPGAGSKADRKAARSGAAQGGGLASSIRCWSKLRTVKDVRVLSAEIEGVDREGLRQLVDPLRQKMGPGVFVLASGRRRQSGADRQRDQGPDQPSARRQDYPVCCQGNRRPRRRSARSGRGWRKRHIQAKKCP